MTATAATPPTRATLDRLGRDLRHVCGQATQAEEIAAALEAHGLNDDIARERYGLQNVFACAEALYTHTPYHAATPAALRTPAPPWGLLPRGLLYALPGAALLVAGPLLSPLSGAGVALLAAVIFGWGWGQGLASVGYRKTGAPLRRFLLGAMGWTLPVAGAVGGLSALPGQQDVLTAGLVGALAGTSFTAFAALLILNRPLIAGLGYLPCLAYLLGLLLGGAAHGPTAWLTLGCAALLPVLAVADPHLPPSGLNLPPPPWSAILAHASSGWLCALFVTLAFGASIWQALGSAALLPVIVSVGPMEVLSLTFQARLRALARQHHDLGRLAWAAARSLLLAWALYLLSLTLLYGLYFLLVPPGDTAWALPATVLPLLVYGSALLVGTVVGNVGLAWVACAAWAAGSLVFVGAHWAQLPAAPLLSALTTLSVMGLAVGRVLRFPHVYR